MTGIIVAPNLEKHLVVRRGILTVPQEDASVGCQCVHGRPCQGLSVNDLPLSARPLELYVRQMGDKFIARMAIRGFQLVGQKLRLHGPWPSYELNQHLTDVESAAWGEAKRQDDPSLTLPFVFDRDASSPYMDYLLVGQFIKEAVLTEVIVKEEPQHGSRSGKPNPIP